MIDKKKLSILISGNGSNMKALVTDMEDPNHPAKPVLVIADRPSASGLDYAKSKNIQTAILDFSTFPNRVEFENKLIKLIKFSESEVICLAGFMRILSLNFTQAIEKSILNIHPSILPLFKGLNTHARALTSGMCLHGATVHLVSEELDAGTILGQGIVPIFEGDNEEALAARVLQLEHKLYPLVLRKFLQRDNSPVLISEI